MALTAKQKAANEADRQKGYANKKAVAKEKVKERKTVTLSNSAKTNAVSSTFGGMLGKAVDALKGRKGQGDE